MSDDEEEYRVANDIGRYGPRYVMNECLPLQSVVVASVLEDLQQATVLAFTRLSLADVAALAETGFDASGFRLPPGPLLAPTLDHGAVFSNAAFVTRYSAAVKGLFLATVNARAPFDCTFVQDAVRLARSEPGDVVTVTTNLLRLLYEANMVRLRLTEWCRATCSYIPAYWSRRFECCRLRCCAAQVRGRSTCKTGRGR
jgi:hypothetical protein